MTIKEVKNQRYLLAPGDRSYSYRPGPMRGLEVGAAELVFSESCEVLERVQSTKPALKLGIYTTQCPRADLYRTIQFANFCGSYCSIRYLL